MRTINILTHCMTCKGLKESDLVKYNECESRREKKNIREREEEGLKNLF